VVGLLVDSSAELVAEQLQQLALIVRQAQPDAATAALDP
jgi:hypothetical protein